MSPQHLKEIKNAIKLLQDAVEAKGAQVKTELTPKGKFRIVVTRKHQTITLAHGYDVKTSVPIKSTTVDILFKGTSLSPREYIVYMTEAEAEDYPWNIQEAQRLIVAFLNGDYELDVSRFLKRRSLHFTAEGLTYKYAAS